MCPSGAVVCQGLLTAHQCYEHVTGIIPGYWERAPQVSAKILQKDGQADFGVQQLDPIAQHHDAAVR